MPSFSELAMAMSFCAAVMPPGHTSSFEFTSARRASTAQGWSAEDASTSAIRMPAARCVPSVAAGASWVNLVRELRDRHRVAVAGDGGAADVGDGEADVARERGADLAVADLHAVRVLDLERRGGAGADHHDGVHAGLAPVPAVTVPMVLVPVLPASAAPVAVPAVAFLPSTVPAPRFWPLIRTALSRDRVTSCSEMMKPEA
jgi:hypothetical protein